MESYIKNKRIFVTGGTGSIGWQIVKDLLRYKPGEVVVYSRDETKQFECSHELVKDAPVRFVVGDIRDANRLREAMQDSHIVFHAAALKHVPVCEQNPFEAFKTNVLGTQNVIAAALDARVEKVIGISTDKAANATNVLGSTKFLAEKLMRATAYPAGDLKTRFCFVRFGNVLGSRGSVVPLFAAQAKAGGPLTLTDPAMTRFFMSVSQAVVLIFKAVRLMRNREIFILKMSAARLEDLAQSVIEIVQEQMPKHKKISTIVVGNREGERTHEVLLSADESRGAVETDDMFILLPPRHALSSTAIKKYYQGAHKTSRGVYESSQQRPLSVSVLKRMLLNEKLI